MGTELSRVPARTLLDGHADPTRPRVDPPRPSRRRWSWRALYRPRVMLALILPLRILAVVGLTAMVAFIVRERGDVNGIVWMRSGVLALLAWTVLDQLRSLAKSARRGRTPRPSGDPAPFLAAVPAQRLVAARRGEATRGSAVRGRRSRGAIAALSWWALVAAVVGICVVAAALVTLWMVEDQTTGDPGPWLIGQILLLVGAAFAIGWTLWLAVRSVADVRSRRRRPLVQRFLNWLVRLLSLNRTSTLTAAASSRGATATMGGGATAGAPSLRPLVIHRVVATTIVATASMMVSTAALAGTTRNQDEPASEAVAQAFNAVVGASPADSASAESGAPQIPNAADGPSSSVLSNAELAATSNAADTKEHSPVPDGAGETSAPPLPTPTSVPAPTGTTQPTTTTTPSTTVTTTTTTPLHETTTTTTPSKTTTTTTTPSKTTTTTTTTTPSTTTTTTTPGCGPRGEPDSDCDGVSDSDEVAYGSDPDNGSSTPEGRTWDTLMDGQTCDDRLDNDLDGHADGADPGCSG